MFLRFHHRLLAVLLFAGCSGVYAQLVPAAGVHSATKTSVDMGPADSATRLEALVLQLRPLAEAKQKLENTVRSLHDPTSASFHHWLSSAEFSQQLAIPESSITAAENWLQSQGFSVTGLSPDRSAVLFSGSVAQVEAAFHTHMHRFRTADGRVHTANVTVPMMPAQLAMVATGLVSLHDFSSRHISSVGSGPEIMGGNGGSNQNLGARDLQVIYSIDKVHTSGFSGQGMTIAVLEESNIYSAGDWLAYRRVYGLTKAFPQGNLVTVNPSGAYPCFDPGPGTTAEATLDAEVATAAAPNATVIVASCQTTVGNDPLLSALSNVVNGPNPPQVVSISYGNSETTFSEGQRQSIELLYMQATARGVSIFVSSGDDGADADYIDRNVPGIYGISTNGRATTQWNVAVGGTDFEDTYFGVTSQYWSPRNSSVDETALSYVPEFTWNGTCGSQLLASYKGFSQIYGANGFCNSPLAPTKANGAGGGGQSACATGSPAKSGVISGTCAGQPKPAWQQNVSGNPNDGVRDVPDVALFASDGVWQHAYSICFSNPAASSNNAACTVHFNGDGGTSASTPLMAGIQLLIDQATGSLWGNPDPVYYALAQMQYGAGNNNSCDASLGNSVSNTCVFHDITAGDTDVPCVTGSPNCYAPSGNVGVLSLSTSIYQPAFTAGPGWDFATGLGSINAANLLSHWSKGVSLSGISPIPFTNSSH